MFAAGMTKRWRRVLATVGLLACLSSCKVYDPAMLEPMPSSGRGGNGGGTAGEAGDASTSQPCVPSVPTDEVCNDKDDDCDGTVDNEIPAGMDCSRRYHATIPCNHGGLCLFIPSRVTCDPGWYHCDGLPETGCEANKPCCVECDAGSGDDAGSDDGGSLN
jgi:hypothetical protein